MSDEKVTVGLTPEAEEKLETVMASSFFREELTAYRVAIAVALARDTVTAEEEMNKVKTKFNIGSLERDGRLRDLIELLRPTASQDSMVSLAERLADAGLHIMADHLEQDRPLRKLLVNQAAK